MNNILAVLIYLAIGLIFSRIKKFPKNTSELLNLLVIYVALPALILERFPLINLDSSALVPAISPWFMLAVSVLFILLASKVFLFTREVTGCLLLVVPLGNTSFLGIPLIQGLLGEPAVSYAIIYDQLGSFMILSTYGSLIMALYSQNQSKFSLTKTLQKIISFPPFIALTVAILFKYIAMPNANVIKLFSTLGNMLVPLAMISVGFQFKGSFEKSDLPVISLGLGFKMILSPIILYACLSLLNQRGLPSSTSVLESGMPPMITAGAVAMNIGLAPKLAAALVGFGILLSFFTLPALQYIFTL